MKSNNYQEKSTKRAMDTISLWAKEYNFKISHINYSKSRFRDSKVVFYFNEGELKGLQGEVPFASIQQGRKVTSRALTTEGRIQYYSILCNKIGGSYVNHIDTDDYKALITYKVVQGQYKGYESRARIEVIHRAIQKENLLNGFQNLTDESKSKYMYDLAQAEGYTILKFPDGLKATNKIKLVCPQGHVREMIWDNFQRGSRCANCKLESKGEKFVAQELTSLGVNFIKQYPTTPNIGERPQFFDFYLPDYKIAIEYNGRQHYEPVEVFGGIKGFEDTLDRDVRKASYCSNNGIRLIKIPYTLNQKDVSDLLKEELAFFVL